MENMETNFMPFSIFKSALVYRVCLFVVFFGCFLLLLLLFFFCFVSCY